LNYKKEEVK